jgi:hypothetical protein
VSTPSARIRVLLVDDHEVIRRGLRGFLELQDDIDVVGSCPRSETVIIGWANTGESPIGNNVAGTFVTKSKRAEDFVAATLAACRS